MCPIFIAKLVDKNEKFRASCRSLHTRAWSHHVWQSCHLVSSDSCSEESVKPSTFLYSASSTLVTSFLAFFVLCRMKLRLLWRKDVNKEDKQQLALPVYFCRECGDSGWIAYKTKKSNSLQTTLVNCYTVYQQQWEIVTAGICVKTTTSQKQYQGNNWILVDRPSRFACIHQQDEERRTAYMYMLCVKLMVGKHGKNPRFVQSCPSCCSDNSLAIIGNESCKTMASVAISQIMSSDLGWWSGSQSKNTCFY